MTQQLEHSGENREEVLAGNRGQCSDYQSTSTFGREREPFTWLSEGGTAEANSSLEGRLQEFKRGREVLRFEAVEFENEDRLVLFSAHVRILYVEVDGRLSKVRALLQWVPEEKATRA